MNYSKAWLQSYLSAPLPDDDELDRVLSLYAFEVESVERVGEDSVFDIKVLPNRAGDCLSHRGMAREISALLSIPMCEELVGADVSRAVLPEAGALAVSFDENVPCRRYIGAIVRGVKVAPSPAWLVARLETVGQRSVNNVVDATNYIMLGYGQPMHAFDAKKISAPSIRIRMATEGETFATLSGEEKKLDTRIALVADGGTGAALAMAGVKGGDSAAVDDATVDLIVESANFEASAVRYASRSRQILTDSAKRFEADLDPTLAREAMERCVSLIVSLAGGTIESAVDAYPQPEAEYTVVLRPSVLKGISGLDLPRARVEEILKARGFETTMVVPGVLAPDVAEESWIAQIPSFRRDVRSEADLVEEIMQQYGYNELVAKPQESVAPAAHADGEVREDAVRHTLRVAGFDECMSYAFRSSGVIELENPLASDKAFLRVNLSDAMRESLDSNFQYVDLAARPAVALYEVGSVFPQEGEKRTVCFGAFDGSKKGTVARSMIATAIAGLETIGVSVVAADAPSAIVEFDVASVDVEKARTYLEAAPTLERSEVRYTQYSPYPVSTRDVALFAPAAGMEADIAATIVAAAGTYARSVRLFDRFEKSPTEVSYGFRIAFQADDKTLGEADLVGAMTAVTEALIARGWIVR